MGDDYDAIVVQMTQLMEHSDPAQQPPWDGSGLPETAAEMQELDLEDLKRKVTLMLSQSARRWGRPMPPQTTRSITRTRTTGPPPSSSPRWRIL